MSQYHPILFFLQLGVLISLGLAGYCAYRLRRFHGRPVGRVGWSVLAVVGAVSATLFWFVVTGGPGLEGCITAVGTGIIATAAYALGSLPRPFVKTLAGGTLAGAATALLASAGLEVASVWVVSDVGGAGLVYLDSLPVILVMLQVAAIIALLFALVFIVPRKLAEQKEALAERIDLMYHELSHRVNNDLSVVLNRLEMAKQDGVDSDSRRALAQSQSMVESVSQVHAILGGRTEPGQMMALGEQVEEVARKVLGRFDLPHVEPAVDDEPVRTEAHAIKNCALMVNELVTNACKYAFEGRDGGTVTVRVACPGTDRASAVQRIEVTVADDGVGLPAPWGSGEAEGTGFGQGLITGLADDLGATLDVESDATGTRATWTFEAAMPTDGGPAADS